MRGFTRRQHVCGNIDTHWAGGGDTENIEDVTGAKPWHRTAMLRNISLHLCMNMSFKSCTVERRFKSILSHCALLIVHVYGFTNFSVEQWAQCNYSRYKKTKTKQHRLQNGMSPPSTLDMTHNNTTNMKNNISFDITIKHCLSPLPRVHIRFTLHHLH